MLLMRPLCQALKSSIWSRFVASAVAAIALAASAQAADAERQKLVQAHLQFGEFGPALKVAKAAADPKDKAELLALVADAQLRAGDPSGASGSIRQIPDVPQRQQAGRQLTNQQGLNGGIAIDFQSLITLIMEETSGGWESDGSGTGTITPYQQGVRVDPQGVLTRMSKEESTGRLKDLGLRAREALLNQDVSTVSDLRVVSLTRLERSVASRIAEGKPAVESQKLLGGLTKVTNVFVYPDLGEIVLAGPAEPWKYNDAGIAVGAKSGRPILQLDDFVDVLRAFTRSNGEQLFTCSINPRPEGLKQLKDLVERSNARGPLPAGAVSGWTKQLQAALGKQDIVYSGIDPESRVARVIIEADYRMKLIGIGKSSNEAKIPSIFDLMTVAEQRESKLDALRWWLTMKYDSVLHSADGHSFEFVGSSVRCQSENQYLDSIGQQVPTGQSDGANRLFAENFTKRYEELAKQDLVFGDLKNVFDLALVASLIHNQGAAKKAHWNYGVFAADGLYETQKFSKPVEVDSVVNHRVYRGRDIVVQVAGGVRADLGIVVNDGALFQAKPQVQATAEQASKAKQAVTDKRWWWDAK